MLNNKFYWGTIRKSVVAFGNLFNKITIDRVDGDGNIVKTIRIPLSYAPKQKFLAKIDQSPAGTGEVDVQVVLPRMSFEMISIDYDPQRKINGLHQHTLKNNTNNTLTTQYAAVPYNLTMALYIYAKNQDDSLQIIEQILPYFNPDFNLTVNSVPDLQIQKDLPIILDSLSYEDTYEGDFSERRAIIWTLMFTVKLDFFGPASKQGIIRKTITNIYSNPELSNLTAKITITPDPVDANPGDDFDYIEVFEEF